MLFFYKVLTVVLYPYLIILIFLRTFVGKEDSNRFKEKLFFQKKEAISDKLLRDYPIQAVNIKITKLETKIESVVIPAGVEIYRSGRGNP